MGEGTLTVRTVDLPRWKRYTLMGGIAALPVGVALMVLGDAVLAGSLVAAAGVVAAGYVWATSLRHAVFLFDTSKRVVTRVGPEGRTQIGTFADFTGVDVVGRVDEAVLRGTSLHQVHQTYPSKSLMRFEVCLVGPGEPVPVVTYKAKQVAIETQQRIVAHCGWTHQSTTIPDAKRLLQ